MTKVVLSSNVSWSLYNFRRNLIKTLLKNDFDVYIVTKSDSYTEKLVELGCKYINVDIDASGTNPFSDLVVIMRLCKIYYKIKPDYILNFSPKNNIYSTFSSYFCNAKIINNIAGLGVAFIRETFISKLIKTMYKFTQHKADVIFFQNHDDKNLFLEHGICKESQVKMLPGSGVDLERFRPSISVDSSKSNKLVFLLVARMLYDKGVKYYVDAARILKSRYGSDVEFSLLGFIESDNPSAVSQEIMDSWTSEGIVNYLGVSDNVENEMEKASCIVLPSYYREGVPRSLLEAAALGKPIITTDSVGCRDAVTDNYNGFLCEPKCLDSLVLALDKFIQMDFQTRLVMGNNSRFKAEAKFDEKIVINKYLSCLQD